MQKPLGFKCNFAQQIAKEIQQTVDLTRCVGIVSIEPNRKIRNGGTLVRPNAVATSFKGLINQKGKKIDVSLVKFLIYTEKDEEQVIDVIDIIFGNKQMRSPFALLMLAQNVRPKLFPSILEQGEQHNDRLLHLMKLNHSERTLFDYRQVIANKEDLREEDIFPFHESERQKDLQEGTPLFIKTKDGNDLKFFGMCERSTDSYSISQPNSTDSKSFLVAVRIFEENIVMMLPYYDDQCVEESMISSGSLLIGKTLIPYCPEKTVNLSKTYGDRQFQEEMAIFQLKDLRKRFKRKNIGLIYWNKGQILVIGTGCVITPRTILTAAHVIVGLKKYMTEDNPAFFYLQIQGELSKSQPIKIIGWNYADQYKTNKMQDYGVMFLSKPVNKSECLALGFEMSQDSQIQVEICGYPLDKYQRQLRKTKLTIFRLYGAIGKITTKNGRAYYDLPTTKGQSGAAIRLKQKKVIIGIHNSATNTENDGCLLIERRIQNIQKWIKKRSIKQLTYLNVVDLKKDEKRGQSKNKENQQKQNGQAPQSGNILVHNSVYSSVDCSSTNQQSEFGSKVETYLQKNVNQYYEEMGKIQKILTQSITESQKETMQKNYKLGLVYRDKKQYKKALEHMKISLTAAGALNGYENYIACIHNAIGTIHEKNASKQSNNQIKKKLIINSLISYMDAYQIAFKSSDKNQIKIALIESNIASIYATLSTATDDQNQKTANSNLAISSYKKSIETLEKYYLQSPQVKKRLISCYSKVMNLLDYHSIYPPWVANILEKLAFHKCQDIHQYYSSYLPQYLNSQPFNLREKQWKLNTIQLLRNAVQYYVQCRQQSMREAAKQCLALLSQRQISIQNEEC